MAYYVYIILCDNGNYYTGYTKDLVLRLKQHKRGSGATYTKMHKPKELVYVEKLHTRSEAVHREHAIKSLTHEKKQELVDLLNS